MVVSQNFQKNTERDSSSRLSIRMYDIDENTKLDDVLNEVKKIYITHFPCEDSNDSKTIYHKEGSCLTGVR